MGRSLCGQDKIGMMSYRRINDPPPMTHGRIKKFQTISSSRRLGIYEISIKNIFLTYHFTMSRIMKKGSA